MPSASRAPFTLSDKDNLAHFLAGIPEHKRKAPSTHKEMARRHPEHSDQAWMHHYVKVDREGIDRRIKKLQRERQRAEQPPRTSKGKAVARIDDADKDQLDNDRARAEVESVSVSTSKKALPRPSAASAAGSTSGRKRKKPLQLPPSSPSSSSPSASSSVLSHSSDDELRVPDTDMNFEQLVKMLYQAEVEEWLKSRAYKELEARDPKHSASAWQKYHNSRRSDFDKSLRAYRKAKHKHGKQRRREDTVLTATHAESPTKKKKKKQVAAPVELSDDERSRASGKTVAENAPGSSTSASKPAKEAAVPPASVPAPTSRTSTSASSIPALARPSAPSSSAAPSKARVSLPSAATASAAHKAPQRSLPASSIGHPQDKGKQRAVSPSPRASPALIGVGEETQALALTAEEGAGEDGEAFTEEDDAQLVHQLTRAEIKGWGKDSVFAYLAKMSRRHSADAWAAHYRANIARFFLQVGHKLTDVLEAQRRKRAAEAAVREEEATRAERARAARAREEADQREREADEQREREERARLDAEEEARREADEAERTEKERVERERAEKVRMAKVRRTRLEMERAKRKARLSSASPPPVPSPEHPASPSAPSTGKPAAAQPAASAVLTPRNTPPTGTSAYSLKLSPLALDSSRAEHGVEAVDSDLGDEGAGDAPVATGSSLPRLSQYSVLPSPFISARAALAAATAAGEDDELDELASSADTDDRALDAQLAAAVAAHVEVDMRIEVAAVMEVKEESLEPALAELVDAAQNDASNSAAWDPLTPDENNLIVNTHGFIQALIDREREQAAAGAPAPPQGHVLPLGEHVHNWLESQRGTSGEVGVAVQDAVRERDEREAHIHLTNSPPPADGLAPSPSRKRRRQESTAPAADRPESPARKRQRVDNGPANAHAHAVAPSPAPAAVAAVAAREAASSSPAVGRRVPRASLAAVQAASSPAPTPAPAPALGTTSAGPSATRVRRPLKDELADIAAEFGHSFSAIRDLFFCCSALSDMTILRSAAAFYSDSARPAEGTAEFARLRARVARHVWSLREDTIVLEGTDEARARVEERKGPGAVERRRNFLRRAKMVKVADLRPSAYVRKV